MPFTGFDQKKLLNSQAVKKKKVKQFCPKRSLTLIVSSFHKVYHREKGGKNPNFGGFNS